MTRTRHRPPPRAGLSPRPLTLTAPGTLDLSVASALAALTGREVDAAWVQRACARGDVVDDQGRALQPQQRVRAGERVFLHAAAPDEPGWEGPLEVVWRGEECVVINKPAGISTAPRGSFVARSVVVAARRAWGNDDVVPAHRLDRLTSGCLLLVTDARARARYHRAFAAGEVAKTYLALTPGAGLEADARHEWRPRLCVPSRGGRVDVGPQGVLTRTSGEVLAVADGVALWRLVPDQGRRHQLRVTLANAGWPILGDPLYGPDSRSESLALHAHTLSFWAGCERVEAEAEVPSSWPAWVLERIRR